MHFNMTAERVFFCDIYIWFCFPLLYFIYTCCLQKHYIIFNTIKGFSHLSVNFIFLLKIRQCVCQSTYILTIHSNIILYYMSCLPCYVLLFIQVWDAMNDTCSICIIYVYLSIYCGMLCMTYCSYDKSVCIR